MTCELEESFITRPMLEEVKWEEEEKRRKIKKKRREEKKNVHTLFCFIMHAHSVYRVSLGEF